jgi:hypothetical protein
VDAVVIVSGDGDFVPLAEYLKQMGVQVEIICFAQSASTKLLEEADIFTDLSKDVDYFLINNKTNPVRKTHENDRGPRNFKNKIRYPKSESALKEQLETMQEESVPLSDKHFTIVRKK